MGIEIQNSTLSAMLLEILLKNKSLALDVFKTIIKDDPHFLDELKAESTSSIVNESKPEGVSEEELNFWVDQHFKEYDAVFKALA